MRTIDQTARRDPLPAVIDDRGAEIAALLEGASLLSRAGNRVSAVAALWSAVGMDPCHLGAHRRLAAALANAGDIGGAVAEYERFFEALCVAGQPERAAAERHYGHALLGDAIPLTAGAAPSPRPVSGPAPLHAHPGPLHQLDAEQSQALRRLAVAGVALVATFAAMLIAGSQIFARGL
ncbi:MAG TPA: hypothetical protein VM070_08845 [Candidatus Saccharimonadales bacterium]|nr:hypothetical protein [Candidatus Saccharimonadales bacterium]